MKKKTFVALLLISYILIARKTIRSNTYINNKKGNKSKYLQHEADNKKNHDIVLW